MAVRLLERSVRLRSFPDDDVVLSSLSNAIMAAWDFRAICHVLPPTPIPSLIEDLRRAVKGSLNEHRATVALRAQSQVNFGALLVAGGLFPQAPSTTGGPSPDYVITFQTLPIAFEVKRPETHDTVKRNVLDAIGQMRGFGARYQAIHLDMTDVVGSSLALTGMPRGELDILAAFRSSCEIASSALHAQAELRVITSYFTAHYCFWSRIGELRLYHSSQVQFEAFPNACSGLVADQGRALRHAILTGASAFGVEVGNLRPL